MLSPSDAIIDGADTMEITVCVKGKGENAPRQELRIKSDAFYDAEIAATALGLSKATLATYRSRACGGLEFSKRGARVFYRGSDLIAFIEAGMRKPGADPERSERARERMAKRLAKQPKAA